MKRSEMIQKMEDFINSQNLMLGADMKQDCKHLLDFMVKEGMLPPPDTVSNVASNVIYIYYYNKYIDPQDHNLNELWDKE
jgi:hypothetical protein